MRSSPPRCSPDGARTDEAGEELGSDEPRAEWERELLPTTEAAAEDAPAAETAETAEAPAADAAAEAPTEEAPAAEAESAESAEAGA